MSSSVISAKVDDRLRDSVKPLLIAAKLDPSAFIRAAFIALRDKGEVPFEVTNEAFYASPPVSFFDVPKGR